MKINKQKIWKERGIGKQEIKKPYSNMIEINPNILVIKINVNDLNFSVRE